MKHKNLLSMKDFDSLHKTKKVTNRTGTGIDVLNEAKDMTVKHSDDKYDYWVGEDDKNKTVYNITPKSSEPKPGGDYYSSDHICKVKKVKNCFNNL